MSTKYYITLLEKWDGYCEPTEYEVTEEQYKKIDKILKPPPPEPKKIVLPYNDLGSETWDDITDEDFDESINEDFEKIEDFLRDGDFVHWDDDSGDKDNKKPFRLLINDKWLIEFKVVRGECIEATWDHRIWRADVDYIKIIEQK